MPARTRSAPPPEPEPAPEPAPEEVSGDSGGWFRNTGAVPLTVLAGMPAVLEPGRIARLERTPSHRDLSPASEAEFAAQQAADTANATPEVTDGAETEAESTEKTEE